MRTAIVVARRLLQLTALSFCVDGVTGLNNGLARTPPMGLNTWTIIGWSVTDSFMREMAAFYKESGLQALGYTYLNSDDGWSAHRNETTGIIEPDYTKFPNGMLNLTTYLHEQGFNFGIYGSASSVCCSGRPGSLYYETIDAQTFASWGVDLVKYDNCGEYALGISRFFAFADAANRTGWPMVISTEPFSLIPTPLHAQFANMWRIGDDIRAQYATITNRADLNDKWAPYTGPGKWADPDMLQVGNGGLTDAECRTHFGLWALMKSPLLIGADARNLTQTQFAIISAAGVIAVNQDPLGIQGRKLAANGTVSPRYVGLTPCATDSINPGVNGATAVSLLWTLLPAGGNGTLFNVFHNATGRCLGTRPYINRALPVPVLVPCTAADDSQLWMLPRPQSVTGLINVALNLSLTVGNSTVYAGLHGNDILPLQDAAYGLTNLTFTPYTPEPPCSDRGCDNYVPEQSWYYSMLTSRLSLAVMSSNIYRCFEGRCYDLTNHYPTTNDYCLAQVASISNDGIDTNIDGVHVWGGPLSGGDFVMALENRGSSTANGTGYWAWLEAPGVDDSTSMCVRELFSNTSLGVFVGSITLPIPTHDMAMLRLTPGASQC